MSKDDDIRILAEELTSSSSEEKEHTEAEKKTKGQETVGKPPKKDRMQNVPASVSVFSAFLSPVLFSPSAETLGQKRSDAVFTLPLSLSLSLSLCLCHSPCFLQPWFCLSLRLPNARSQCNRIEDPKLGVASRL